MSKKISLKQFLMRSGMFERVSECVAAIRDKKVSVNNEVIDVPNHYFNSDSLVQLMGKKIKPVKKLYLLMNKPSGVLSQKTADEKTIYDLLEASKIGKDEVSSLFAVGRLDKATEGLMLITNDGKLGEYVLHPSNNIAKKYKAILEKAIDLPKVKSLEKGVFINTEDGNYKTKKCNLKVTGESEVYITLYEGKKRQVRKMFEAIDNKVIYLKRVSLGALQVGKMKPGEIKQLTREEAYSAFEALD